MEHLQLNATSESPPSSVDLPDWWDNANDWLNSHCSTSYGCYFYYLAGAYGILAIIALVQLIRIQLRVPEYGWTTQKVFHLMNCLVCLIRAVTFGLYSFEADLEKVTAHLVIQLIIFDLPGLLFFTAYTLLVLFWAEIYHQASQPEDTKMLRPWFVRINVGIYCVAAILWLLSLFDFARNPVPWARMASAGFLAFVSLVAVISFLVYGCRLFAMLRQFPIESRGRKKKLQEVGFITFIGSFCFAARAVLISLFIVMHEDAAFDIDMLGDPLLNIVFYVLCEIFIAAAVLGILHRLPPKRQSRVPSMQRSYEAVPDKPGPVV
ncbi:hypothetical protein BSKO_08940 [Bryopsis sp. KO-2023]|nr:hypothetical protein BSKO_08940 [Bryopsis sp. KO-2023]